MDMNLNDNFLAIENNDLQLVNGGESFWYYVGKVLYYGIVGPNEGYQTNKVLNNKNKTKHGGSGRSF